MRPPLADAKQDNPRRFIVDVEETMRLVLEQEDTDGNMQITIEDAGPKVRLLVANGHCVHRFLIRPT